MTPLPRPYAAQAQARGQATGYTRGRVCSGRAGCGVRKCCVGMRLESGQRHGCGEEVPGAAGGRSPLVGSPYPRRLDQRPLLQLAHHPQEQPPRPPSRLELERASRQEGAAPLPPRPQTSNGHASSPRLRFPPSSHRRHHWSSVSFAGASAMPSRNGSPAKEESQIKRSFRRHRPLLEVAPNQALAPSPLPLLHHADLGYQVCGNGTRAVLSHGEPVWEDTRDMEGEAKLPLLRLSNN